MIMRNFREAEEHERVVDPNSGCSDFDDKRDEKLKELGLDKETTCYFQSKNKRKNDYRVNCQRARDYKTSRL